MELREKAIWENQEAEIWRNIHAYMCVYTFYNLFLVHEFEIYLIHSKKLHNILFQIKLCILFKKYWHWPLSFGPNIGFSQMFGESLLYVHLCFRTSHKYCFNVLYISSDYGSRMICIGSSPSGCGIQCPFFTCPPWHHLCVACTSEVTCRVVHVTVTGLCIDGCLRNRPALSSAASKRVAAFTFAQTHPCGNVGQ